MNKNQKETIETFLATMKDMLIAKGHDYAGEDDTLANFRYLEDAGVTAELHIFTRITDKYARIKNYFATDGDLKVSSEKIDDTLLDLANYIALLYLARKERAEKEAK